MTPQLRAFFQTLDSLFPADFINVLDKEDNVVFMVQLSPQGTPVKVQAFHSYPALGEYEKVAIGRDWVLDKVWFRKRPLYNPASFTRAKYECFVSYDEAHRPEFEVDLLAPIFSLTLTAN